MTKSGTNLQPRAQAMNLEVLFCDNHLLAVIKPPALASQTHGPGQDSLEIRAKAWIKIAYSKRGDVFLQPIHRIDKAAGGIVLFARTSKALSRLHAQMREGAVEKIYYALVEGIPQRSEGELIHYLVHDDYKARIVLSTYPQSKRACLWWETKHRFPQKALLRISLLTGRYHQIRAQLAAIGHPICGDRKYGSTHQRPMEGIALHHTQVTLHHPTTQQIIQLTHMPQWPEIDCNLVS